MKKLRKVHERRIVERRKPESHKMRRHWVKMNRAWGYTPEVVAVDAKTGKKTWVYTRTTSISIDVPHSLCDSRVNV
jgi:hypothetical protein